MARPSGRDIRRAALEAAGAAIRSKGVTGFSYGDLAQQIGVRAPSLHHHFRHKDELVAETAARHRAAFRAAVDAIDEERAIDRIRRFGQHFLSPALDDELCLCGAAVAGWDQLNPAAKAEVTHFFEEQVAWVERQLAVAAAEGDLHPGLDPSAAAHLVVSTLEGALLLERAKASKRSPDAVLSALTGLLIGTGTD